MKERPILFNAAMVRAILDGSKTQTRRVVSERHRYHFIEGCGDLALCPYGQPGDRLWVREAWSTHACFDDISPAALTTRSIHYLADGTVRSGKGRPSIHMPRWASRINLEVTGVRVERLNDISEADAVAEGCVTACMTPTGEDNGSAIWGPDGYAGLWESINGADSWAENPWVWVVEFRRLP